MKYVIYFWGTTLDVAVGLGAAEPASHDRVHALGILLEEQIRLLLHARKQRTVAQQIGDVKVRHAGLARAEHLSRAAHLQVAPRDLEPVAGLAPRREPRSAH